MKGPWDWSLKATGAKGYGYGLGEQHSGGWDAVHLEGNGCNAAALEERGLTGQGGAGRTRKRQGVCRFSVSGTGDAGLCCST